MSKDNKHNHVILKTAATAAVGSAAAYGSYAYLLFRNAFDTDHSRYHPDGVSPNSEETAIASDWYNAANITDEYLRSYDGLTLHAVRAENHPDAKKWMILMHGYHRCAWDLLPLMAEADKRGWNLLVPDQRGSGKSEGKYTGLGWPEHYDLLSWVNYLSVLRPESEIVLYGIDLGANAVMNACGDYLSANVKCAIEEGGWSDIQKQFYHAAEQESPLPVKPFLPAVDLLVRQFLGYSMKEVSTMRQISRCRIPVLCMHGEQDLIVPVSNAREIHDALPCEKELVIFPHTGFGGCRYNEEYFNTLFDFAQKHTAKA